MPDRTMYNLVRDEMYNLVDAKNDIVSFGGGRAQIVQCHFW